MAFTTRLGGVSAPPYDSFNLARHVGDDPELVKKNRIRLWQALNSVRSIQWLNQIHGVDCVEASGATTVPVADACFTRESGLACAILTADCLPVLLASEDGRQVAAAHAGWRGLANGVLAQTLSVFDNPTAVKAYLGACIGREAFEVGSDVRKAFASAPDTCFRQGNSPDRWWADLPAIATWQLNKLGVIEVYDSGFCTYQAPQDFFSYRRSSHGGNAACGRQASLIWIDSDISNSSDTY
ncbi:MAG: peptidoglycan editing factor PgeF [Oceanobacter sp.]